MSGTLTTVMTVNRTKGANRKMLHETRHALGNFTESNHRELVLNNGESATISADSFVALFIASPVVAQITITDTEEAEHTFAVNLVGNVLFPSKIVISFDKPNNDASTLPWQITAIYA